MKLFSRLCLPAILGALAVLSQAGPLNIEVGQSRSVSDMDATVKAEFHSVHARLELYARKQRNFKTPFIFPMRIELYSGGKLMPYRAVQGRANGLTLAFNSSGSGAFTSGYQAYLQSVWSSAQSTVSAVFGPPAASVTVHVLNDDAAISDRRAVVGGYYVPNGLSGPEIRLPVNLDQATAGINFLHCVMLAYQGATPYPFDAYEEGLVRAAVVKVARTPNAIPGVTSDQIEAVLSNLYQADERYDWLNQSALAGPLFIAPNLLTQALPAGGSTGGIYLIRHQMAGSAWTKVMTQYPGFAAEFNRRYYASPLSFTTAPQLEALAQTALDTVSATSGATVEGFSFSKWAERQHILDTELHAGQKVMIEPTPLAPESSADFGVFAIAVHAFKTDTLGNENLLAGTVYPVYFRPDFTRFFVAAQDDVASVANGYGSVAPNFPSDEFGGQVYMATVDAPFNGSDARVRLPAGAIFDPSGNPNSVYGTLSGIPRDNGTYQTTITWQGKTAGPYPVSNGVFAGVIADPSFRTAQPVVVSVTRILSGGNVNVVTRTVDKGLGSLALDMRAGTTDTTSTLSLPTHLVLTGLTVEPYRPGVLDVTQLNASDALVGRYDSIIGGYVYYPDEGEIHQGNGYFIRPYTANSVSIDGRGSGGDGVLVSLKPGWNMVTNSTGATISVNAIKVASTSLDFQLWTSSSGTENGANAFSLVPDALNPNGGTFTAITSLSPGQAVYVRCLDPNGAVLLFDPANATANAIVDSTIPRGTGEWTAKLNVTTDMLQKSAVVMGMKKAGTVAEQPKLDMSLPKSVGGFQASVEQSGEYFQKFMPLSLNPVFLRFSQVPIGRWVTIQATSFTGDAKSLVFDDGHGNTWTIANGGSFRFKATSASFLLAVTVR